MQAKTAARGDGSERRGKQRPQGPLRQSQASKAAPRPRAVLPPGSQARAVAPCPPSPAGQCLVMTMRSQHALVRCPGMLDDAGERLPPRLPTALYNGSFSAAEIAFAPADYHPLRACQRSISVAQLACWISLSSRRCSAQSASTCFCSARTSTARTMRISVRPMRCTLWLAASMSF